MAVAFSLWRPRRAAHRVAERTSGAGCGDGVRPCRRLAGRRAVPIGHEVAIIDRDATAFNRLSPSSPASGCSGWASTGKCCCEPELSVRRRPRRGVLGDNSNIIAARVAREMFGVRRVVARIYDAKRAAVYERLGIPTVATVPWTTDRLLNTLTHETETTKWRDPTGTVAVCEAELNESWVGHRVTTLEETTGARVAFVIRFGTGVLPEPRTVIQVYDQVYLAAVSGHAAEALAIAAQPPAEGSGNEGRHRRSLAAVGRLDRP